MKATRPDSFGWPHAAPVPDGSARPRAGGRSRRRRSRALVALAGVAVLALAGCRTGPPRPDVLLVTIDTLRADRCSAYGYEVPTTPNLDRLAQSGVLYLRAYAESSTTAPSHAVLMTGRHFRTLGVTRNGSIVPEDAVMLAEAMHGAGYATAAFVSSFPVMTKFGFAQGFEEYDDRFTSEDASLGRRSLAEPHDRLGAATLARAEAWLAARKDPRPLFAWVHFVDPHAPYRAPERFRAKWPDDAKPADLRYDAEVHYADKQLGKLLEAFERLTPDREDFVIVTSDHGEGLGDHGWQSHGVNLHEEAVRVPLVARWPSALDSGRVVEDPVALVDIAPGILRLLGIEGPTFAHGREMFGRTDPARRVFLQRRDYRSTKEKGRKIAGPMTAVVESGAKLILAPEEDRRELYDLVGDPAELHDLLGGAANAGGAGAASGGDDAGAAARTAPPEHEGRARALEESLDRWMQAVPAAGEDAALDEETLKALRSLGYVD